MADLFTRTAFTGFGPSRLCPELHKPLTQHATGRSTAFLRRAVAENAPKLPGIYGMIDARRQLIYVGKAKSLRTRLLSYFRAKSRDVKAGRIIEQTRVLVWEVQPTEFAALLRELELIRRHRPRFNVVGQPGRQRFSYLCIGRDPAPYAYAARRPTGKEVALYGPVPGTGRAAEAARRLNDYYRLRDCSQKQPMHFADQATLFSIERTAGCLRYEIATCLGPCVGAPTRATYAAAVRRVQQFLEGRDTAPLVDLAQAMTGAATAMQFERAAALRDKLADLRWLADHLGWLRQARQQNSFIYPLAGHDGAVWWYYIHKGRVWAVAAAPTDAASRSAAHARIDAIYAARGTVGGPLPADEVDSILLVAGWFRKHGSERARLLTPAEARSRCQAPHEKNPLGGVASSAGQNISA